MHPLKVTGCVCGFSEETIKIVTVFGSQLASPGCLTLPLACEHIVTTCSFVQTHEGCNPATDRGPVIIIKGNVIVIIVVIH